MRKRARHLLFPLAVTVVAAAAAVTASMAADSTSLPATVPSTATPNINDAAGNTVLAVTRVGSRIIVGGLFQSATNHGSPGTVLTRSNILAFDAATGLIDTGFAPVVDGEVFSLMPGPTADTVYVGGQFSHVGGVNHFKIVELSTVTGAPVAAFKPTAPNGIVTDLAMSHGHLILGGTFTSLGNAPVVARGGLASMDPTTGTLDSFVTVTLAGHHNWVPGSSTAQSGVGVDRFDVSPDGNKLIIVGNFKTANGASHDQGLLLDLSGASATVMPWFAPGLTAPCDSVDFDEWVRDVAFSQDGSYFVVVGTGSVRLNTLCDSAERFNMTDASNTASQPVWVDHTGGDTLLSVATTSAAIYVGGHIRWLNNSAGSNSAGAGAVGRAGIAALDPKSGLPMAWNPGHHPRGFGIQGLYVDSTGLYVGSDQDYFGAFTYQRAKIGFLPFVGGYTPPAGQVAALPAKIYQPGGRAPLQPVLYRVNAGGPQVTSTDSGPDWVSDNGATSQFHGTGGSIVSFPTQITNVNSSVPAGTPLQLFSDTRLGSTTAPFMKWSFPAPAGTPVTVRIFYADRATPPFVTGQRVFSLTINNKVVEPAMDIVGKFGQNTAGVKAYQAVATAGSVDITFTPSKDAPELSAIEIRRANIAIGTGISSRTFDGTHAGTMTPVGGADGTPWANMHGAMLVDNQLYYGMTDGNLYRRTFDGHNLGAASVVNPFSDPFWDTQGTGTGTTVYAGVKSTFYAEIPTLAAMYYDGNGKLYYTRAGLTGLYWRWFSPDSGITGADEFTVSTTASFASASGALFISGGNLYWSTTNGNMNRIGWTGTTTSGTATAVSGPTIDGQNWASTGAFIGH